MLASNHPVILHDFSHIIDHILMLSSSAQGVGGTSENRRRGALAPRIIIGLNSLDCARTRRDCACSSIHPSAVGDIDSPVQRTMTLATDYPSIKIIQTWAGL